MIKKVATYFPSVLIPIIGNILFTIIVGNYLRPSEFGVFNMLVTLVTLTTVIVNSYTNHSYLRLFDEKEKNGEGSKLFSTLFFYILLNFPVLFLLNYIFLEIYSFLSVIIVFYSLANLIGVFLRVNDKIFFYNLLKSFPVLVQMVLILTLVFFSELNSMNVFLTQYIPLIIIVLIFIILFLVKKQLKITFDKSLFYESLKIGLPLSLINIISLLLMSIDNFVLYLRSSTRELGYFTFAARISDLIMLTLVNLIIFILYPILIKIYNEKGMKETEKVLNKYFNTQIIFSLPFLMIGIFYAEDLLDIFFSQYVNAALILRITLLGSFLFALTYYTNKPHELSKKPIQIIKPLCIVLFLKIILSIVLVEIFESLGSAISSFISFLIYFLLTYRVFINEIYCRIEYKLISLFVLFGTLSIFIYHMLFHIISESKYIIFLEIVLFLLSYFIFYKVCIKKYETKNSLVY